MLIHFKTTSIFAFYLLQVQVLESYWIFLHSSNERHFCIHSEIKLLKSKKMCYFPRTEMCVHVPFTVTVNSTIQQVSSTLQ